MNQTEFEVRKQILHHMDYYLSDLQPYEEAYSWWISEGMPDEADESDYEFVAKDNKLFAEVCVLFGKICQWINEEEKGA